MAIKEVWYGSIGPFLFDTDNEYPDGKPHEPVHEFELPTEPGSAASKEYVDGVMQDHLDAPDPHTQYQMKAGVFTDSDRQRGRGTETEQRHGSARIYYSENR